MRVTAADLGDNLAQLVWESFTDFIERQAAHATNDKPEGGTAVLALPRLEAEEVLIFFMWLHTRACVLACEPEAATAVLDVMHRALYEDLEARAISRVQLPLFEQRVAARYREYNDAASAVSDQSVVEVAARNVLLNGDGGRAGMVELAEATTATSGPLRDYLLDLEVAVD
jgi:hypothetical protein